MRTIILESGKTYSGERDVIFEQRGKLKGMITLEECVDCLVRITKISGGEHNLLLLQCTRTNVEAGQYLDPAGKETPHNVLLDKCVECNVSVLKISGRRKIEDHINLFDCVSCGVSDCEISGPTATSGTGICIDGNSIDCWAVGNTLKDLGPTGITVGGGRGHKVIENRISGCSDCGVRVANYYGGKTTDVRVEDNKISKKIPNRVWVDPKTTARITVVE